MQTLFSNFTAFNHKHGQRNLIRTGSESGLKLALDLITNKQSYEQKRQQDQTLKNIQSALKTIQNKLFFI